MKTPKSLELLVRDGFIDEVIHPLKSGKEAAVYVVQSEGEVRCAKVYKAANKRGFHKQALYQEGRKVRNSRQARAMEKNPSLDVNSRKRFGKMPKLMLYIVLPLQVSVFRNPISL